MMHWRRGPAGMVAWTEGAAFQDLKARVRTPPGACWPLMIVFVFFFLETHVPGGYVCDSLSSSLFVEGTAAFWDGTLALNFKPTLIRVYYAAQDRKVLGEGEKQGRLNKPITISVSLYPLSFPLSSFVVWEGALTYLCVSGWSYVYSTRFSVHPC